MIPDACEGQQHMRLDDQIPLGWNSTSAVAFVQFNQG
jgi:hypothetical protein